MFLTSSTDNKSVISSTCNLTSRIYPQQNKTKKKYIHKQYRKELKKNNKIHKFQHLVLCNM